MKFLVFSVLLILGALMPSVVMAKVPLWAKDGTKKYGNRYITTCNASGPSVAEARQACIFDAVGGASEQLSTDTKVEKMSVESLDDVSLHSSVTSAVVAKNLICTPLKEEVEEKEDHFNVWIQCEFDLSKITVVQNEANPKVNSNANENLDKLSERRVIERGKPENRTPASDFKYISLSIVPRCTDILIQGEKPRAVFCKNNPVELVLYPSDKTLTVRATGHLPKSISASDFFKSERSETNVVLDPMR